MYGGRCFKGFPGGSEVKNQPENAGDAGGVGLIPGSGRSPRGENGNPLQCSFLENFRDRRGILHGVTKESDTTGHEMKYAFTKKKQ